MYTTVWRAKKRIKKTRNYADSIKRIFSICTTFLDTRKAIFVRFQHKFYHAWFLTWWLTQRELSTTWWISRLSVEPCSCSSGKASEIFRGLGKDNSWKKSEAKISWHCPFEECQNIDVPKKYIGLAGPCVAFCYFFNGVHPLCLFSSLDVSFMRQVVSFVFLLIYNILSEFLIPDSRFPNSSRLILLWWQYDEYYW